MPSTPFSLSSILPDSVANSPSPLVRPVSASSIPFSFSSILPGSVANSTSPLVRSCSGSSHRNQEAEPWSDPEDFCEDEELEMAEASSTSGMTKFKGQSGDEAIIMLEQADSNMRNAINRGLGDARVQTLLAGFLDQMDPYTGP